MFDVHDSAGDNDHDTDDDTNDDADTDDAGDLSPGSSPFLPFVLANLVIMPLEVLIWSFP